MAKGLIRRGDICLVNFAPARENEADNIRPAVIVTNNAANAQNVVVTVIPLTTNVERVYHFQVLLPNQRTGLDHDSKAQVEQIRSVALSRVRKRLGQVPADLMAELDDRIRLHLAL
ncbi:MULTISPECIES: type II toxin-antitoxin system PemK/MazF family toxin [Deinococcus]|uniref:mRNA interferase n=1 Tax=Deinococcus multiflagellatus TaxID=1656887 RepID=A0ABW1ZLW2_9DEIO|nr:MULTISPECIES: type II toxin-antitoxin system PemK/MazF family toxin [Deinococcus]MBZ9713388.1 type II toxin-antitoxin system PemK/MazF family toxin [Deinococcus multiflagellatus]